MFRILFAFLFAGSVLNADAQEMWGISNSNYSGNMGIFLNPSTIVGAPYKYEINYFALDIFAENSYMYAPSSSSLILKSITGNAPADKVFIDRFTGPTQYGFGRSLLIGPSYINSSKQDRAWGFHTALRTEMGVPDAPTELTKFIYEKYAYAPLYFTPVTSPAFGAAFLYWAEFGGTYGRIWKETEEYTIKWAVTGNINLGFDGMYLHSRSMDYTFIAPGAAIVHNMDITLAHSLDQSGQFTVGSLFKPRGIGPSTTAGITYVKLRNRAAYSCENGDDRKKYKYRIGLSAMDVGFVYFFSDHQILTAQTTTDRPWFGIDSIKFGSFQNLDGLIVNNITGGIEDKPFSIWLPAALSLQFDYSFTPNIYANASIVNRVYFLHNEIARGNSVNLSARYEKRLWEANANFTMFEYDHKSFGVGFRYKWLVIGTDRLGQILGLSDLYSFDLFFGIKVQSCSPPFKKKNKNCAAYGKM